MRRLFSAGLVVASLTGITYAQVERTDQSESWREAFDAARQPKTCRDLGGIARDVGVVTTVARTDYQCVLTWGDGFKGSGAAWIRVTPPASR